MNVTHITPYKRYEGKTNDLLIAFGYGNDLNKLKQFEVSVQKSQLRFQCTLQLRRATRAIAKRVEKCTEVDGGIFEH